MRIRHDQQRVAVGRGLSDRIGTNDRTRSRAILDQKGLFGLFGKMLSEHPRVHIRGPTRAKRDDEFNGSIWIILCCNRQSQQNWQYEGRQTQKHAHKSSASMVLSDWL